jgi:uncharacterized protein (UPF0303 family)
MATRRAAFKRLAHEISTFARDFIGGKAHVAPMNLEADLEKIGRQERVLQFKLFDEQTAWEIGSRIKNAAEKKAVAVAIDIYVVDRTLFAYAMPGTTPNQANWIRRKRNVVLQFRRCSYAIGLSLQRDRGSLAEGHGFSPSDYATHGGSFPINVIGTGFIGVITVSGLPQRQDHALVIEVLADFLGEPIDPLALD